ncbi:unnamed protein product [Rhizoctonia solani]|uniref:Uncharacterized protein n=1 Tax=Rhizoctonia solani TaxID=456999 RepID=A0A8H3BNY9_9AGAM|nr:unnamed protein product [Rhizoctonia solani]
MGIFSDDERGSLEFEEGSETSSNIDEREAPGLAVPTAGNAFDQIDMSGVTAPAALLVFAEGCCEEFRLSDAVREDVMRTAGLPTTYMMVRLYARAMAMGQDATKTQVDDFFRSNTFKEHIKRRIQGGLLDPNIPYYVRGCTARFVRHMRENPTLYDIPRVVQERLLTTKKFSSAIAEILSGFRGEIRRKIFGSIEDKTDIASTAEKLAIQGFQLSEDHLKQFALLRQLFEDYIEAEAGAQAKKALQNAGAQSRNRGKGKKKRVDGAPQKAQALWTYIDAQMNRFWKYPAAKRTDLLKNILRQDRKKYPDPTGQARWFPASNRLIVSPWQADASLAIQVMAGYTLTAAQEGQEVPLTGTGATDEGEGAANREGPPEEEEEEEEDRAMGGGEGEPTPQAGAVTNGNFQDNDGWARATSHQQPGEHHPPEGAETAPTSHSGPSVGNINSSLPNNGAPGNPAPRGPQPLDSAGPVRGTPGPQPQGGRIATLAQTSRGSPFPSNSRLSKSSGGGALTRSKTGVQRPPVVEPYNPVDSETAAASVGI